MAGHLSYRLPVPPPPGLHLRAPLAVRVGESVPESGEAVLLDPSPCHGVLAVKGCTLRAGGRGPAMPL